MKQILLLPELFSHEDCMDDAVNVASVPQRSPFRYPGGKTWLVPIFRRWIKSLPQKPNRLVEPFAGGGIISLTALFEKLTERVLMVELDKQIAAVWESIVANEGGWLATRILEFDLTLETAIAELKTKRKTRREIAFQTILRNRTLHGGILAEGSGFLKNGENGKGILSRWYPQTIARRITNLSMVTHRMEFIHGDAFDTLRATADDNDSVFFIDPPYTAGGKKAGSRLYTHFELDHERLFSFCKTMRGDFLMTYDNAPEVMELARKHNFQVKPVSMKNTHHAKMTELLIGRNLDWLEETSRIQENPQNIRTPHRKA